MNEGRTVTRPGQPAGVVADSDPELEFPETVNKAKAMIKAVAMARKGLRIGE